MEADWASPRSQDASVMIEVLSFGWRPAIQQKSRGPRRADCAPGSAPRPGRDQLVGEISPAALLSSATISVDSSARQRARAAKLTDQAQPAGLCSPQRPTGLGADAIGTHALCCFAMPSGNGQPKCAEAEHDKRGGLGYGRLRWRVVVG